MSWHPPTSRSPLKIVVAFLALVAASPLLAAPPVSVDVVLENAVPIVGDAYVYETIAGDAFGDPARANLALDLFLRNDEPAPVTIDHVTLDFDSPNIASIVLDSGLQMWCQGVGTMMTGASGLVMPAGARCRLGLTPNPLLALPVPAELTISVAYAGIWTGTLIPQRDLSSYQNSTPTGAYRMPAKAEDLGPGLYWSGRPALSGERHRFKSRTDNNEVFAYDLGVIRKDAGGTWVATRELEPGDLVANDENDDFLCWGEPIYAMADGEVLAFAGGNNDNTPGSVPPGAAANFFSIQHGDETVWYGHLRKNSLNPLMMSIGATVEEGDLLGECGNSGDSSAPHLHVSAVRDGDPMPLHFNDAFLVERSAFVSNPPGNMDWYPFKGVGLSPSLTAIWPSGLRRRGEASDVAIDDVAIVAPSTNRTLTAAITSGGNLRVSSWSTDDTGAVALLDTETGGGVEKVSLAVPNGSFDGALAMITSGGALKLSGLDLSGSSLTRTVDYTSNTAKDVAAASAPFTNGIVTAIRTQFDNLKVIAWEVDPAGAAISQGGDDAGGAIEEVAVARTYSFPGVVVAVRNGSNNLELLTFQVSAAGATVARDDDFEDFEADRISIVRLGPRSNGDDLVVTAVRNASKNLELVSWSIEPDGDIVRLHRFEGGEIGEASVARSSGRHVLTAVTDADGKYELLAWHVDDGGNFTRRTESRGGAATAVAQEGTKTTNGLTIAVSAMADGLGDLKLVVHQVQLTD